jgi:hypothetical protein
MSVFLRWGIFGIIGLAALMYAFNASKQLAEQRSAQVKAVPAPQDVRESVRESVVTPESESEPQPEPAKRSQPAPHCEAELEIAHRALEARRQREPIDRLLRIQEIAFQEQSRRQRLESVATRWYQLEGDEPSPEALSVAVISDCERVSLAP